MRKIAIISDIHGNIAALKAVLDDIDTNFTTSEIYCLGDLVDAAPFHNEVISLIKSRNIPTVMGNHDERIVLDSVITPLTKLTDEENKARIIGINYTKDSITEDNKKHLATFANEIWITTEETSCLLVHGSPISNTDYIFENHDEEEVKEWFEKFKADVIITGHTHQSYIRPICIDGSNDKRLLINAGSVGRTRENIGAKAVYLWLTLHKEGRVSTTIRQVEYDINHTIEGIRASDIPNFYAELYESYLEE